MGTLIEAASNEEVLQQGYFPCCTSCCRYERHNCSCASPRSFSEIAALCMRMPFGKLAQLWYTVMEDEASFRRMNSWLMNSAMPLSRHNTSPKRCSAIWPSVSRPG